MVRMHSLLRLIPTAFYIAFVAFTLQNCQEARHSFQDKDVFRYNEFRNVTSLDPAFARNPQNIWPVNQLFNGLVQLDEKLTIRPDIASSWTLDKSGLEYTFSLRKDVFFHESDVFGSQKTRAVEAADFVYSFQRLVDPKVGSPGGWVMQNVDTIFTVDKHSLKILLKKPFPAFLGLLAMRYCSVVPKEATEKPGFEFRKNPIGTGPFKFQFWEEEVKLVLRKNPLFYEKDSLGYSLPYLEAVAIQFIPDIQSEFMLFLQGKFDFLNSLDSSYKDELLTPSGELQPKYKDQLNIQVGPYLNTEYIGIYRDAPNPALQSKEIRSAMSMGFDRSKMILYLRNNIGFPATKGFIPMGLAGHLPNPQVAYNPTKARELVNSFVKRTAIKPQLRLATDANYLDICQYLQKELEKIGIEIQIDLMPTASLRQAKSSGKLELFRASWIADYPDAENYLGLFYSKNFSPNGPNYTHYSNPTFDRTFEASYGINSIEKRKIQYQKLDSLVVADQAVIPLYYDKVIRFVQKNVDGLSLNPINILSLKTVKKE